MWKLNEIKPTENNPYPMPQKPGDLVYAHWLLKDLHDDQLSPEYHAVKHLRSPMLIGTPNAHGQGCGVWGVDYIASKSDHGWAVSGDSLEVLTITPSINCVGQYHGWVQNGFLTNDCEGRTFPNWPDTP